MKFLLEKWLIEHRKTCAVVCRDDVWFSDAYSLDLAKK